MAALRISCAGASAAVLQRLLPLVRQHRVQMVHVEWDGDGDLAGLLKKLVPLGYAAAYHRGPICAARWEKARQVVRNLPRDEAYPYAPNVDVQQEYRCHLAPDAFAELDRKLLASSKVEVLSLQRSPLWPAPA